MIYGKSNTFDVTSTAPPWFPVIRGKVVDESGLGIPGIPIHLQKLGEVTTIITTSTIDGNFIFDQSYSILPGFYKIWALFNGKEPGISASRACAISVIVALPFIMLKTKRRAIPSSFKSAA